MHQSQIKWDIRCRCGELLSWEYDFAHLPDEESRVVCLPRMTCCVVGDPSRGVLPRGCGLVYCLAVVDYVAKEEVGDAPKSV